MITKNVLYYLINNQKAKIMSEPIKTLIAGEIFELEEIYNLIVSFDPIKDKYTEEIQNPKNGEVYLHFSSDYTKLNDWKADGIIWHNGGQKSVNQKSNILYRSLFHLRISKEQHTNKFVKKVFRIPNSLTPTIVCYEGDEKLHIQMSHGNRNKRNQIFVRAKPSFE